MAIDFTAVKVVLKRAVRTCLDALKAKHPKETFYAFALYDADGTGPTPAANSEQKWLKIIEKQGLRDDPMRFLYRWSTAEWAYEAVGCEPFHPAWEILEKGGGTELLARSLATSIQALKELSDEGYFGSGASRVMAFVSLSDDATAAWLERESARRINPPEAFAAFEPEWRHAIVGQYGPKIHEDELSKEIERILGPS
jgi:hypothetical protein